MDISSKKKGITALQIAVQKPNINIIYELVRQGADIDANAKQLLQVFL
ncbi:hypothetical protein [Candidatus Synchoanobacter obligatus]